MWSHHRTHPHLGVGTWDGRPRGILTPSLPGLAFPRWAHLEEVSDIQDTGCLPTTGGFNTPWLVCTFLEAGHRRPKPCRFGLVRSSSCSQTPVFRSSSGGRGGELPGVSLARALISFMGLHPHDLITFRRPHLLPPPLWRIGLTLCILGGHIQAIRWRKAGAL